MFPHLMRRLLTASLCLAAMISGDPPVWAGERIWDGELRRYLTEEEMSHQEVFMTEEDAVKTILQKAQRIRKDTVKLSPDQKVLIESRIGWKFPEESFDVYVGETGTRVDGYAVLQNTIGKHKHMTYMIGVDSRGRVSDVELLVFREAKGSEVGRKRFNAQYEDKTVVDPIRINKDIINISGATMSVRSMSAGVKRALVLVDELYLKPIGLGSDTIQAQSASRGFWGTIFGN